MSPRKAEVIVPIEKPTEDKVVVEKKISDAAIKTAVKVYEKPLPSPKIYNKDKEPAPFATPNDYMQQNAVKNSDMFNASKEEITSGLTTKDVKHVGAPTPPTDAIKETAPADGEDTIT